VYVLLQSELPADRGRQSCAGGFTSPTLDLQYRDVIAGRWRGRGPALVVNDVQLNELPEIDRAPLLRSVALHEAAHVFERPRLVEALPADDAADPVGASRLLSSLCDAGLSAAAEAAMHAVGFTRVACHVAARAMGLGAFDPGLVVGGWSRPRHSGYFHLASLLGDELDAHRGSTFAEIRTLPVPPAFAAAVLADMEPTP
jgi:hypothetical protein